MAEMTRGEFVKCCAAGMCSWVALTVAAPGSAVAQSSDPEMDRLKWQLEAARIRYAKLLGSLDQNVDEATRKKILDSVGRECARQFRSRTFDKYKGDIQGFLKSIQGPDGWVEKVEYDEKAGTIRIYDRSKTCTCPLVKEGLTSAEQCDCSLGWQRETYAAILERPVEAVVEKSILRGDKGCVFRIQIV